MERMLNLDDLEYLPDLIEELEAFSHEGEYDVNVALESYRREIFSLDIKVGMLEVSIVADRETEGIEYRTAVQSEYPSAVLTFSDIQRKAYAWLERVTQEG